MDHWASSCPRCGAFDFVVRANNFLPWAKPGRVFDPWWQCWKCLYRVQATLREYRKFGVSEKQWIERGVRRLRGDFDCCTEPPRGGSSA